MQVEKKPKDNSNKHKSYLSSWEEFVYQMPIRSRFTLKFKRQRQIFILKVTDGNRIIMKKAYARGEFDRIQKVVETATELLTRQIPKVEQIIEDKKAKKNKKQGKKKN